MDALNPARPESIEEAEMNAGEVQPEEPKSQEGDAEAQASADAELDLPTPLRADSALTDAVTAFNNYMVRKGFSENTMKAFRNDLKILVNFLDGATPLHRITTQHLEEFLEWLQFERGKPCSAKTLARRITTLKVFFGWVHGIHVIGTDPAEPIVQMPAKTPLPNVLRDDEIGRLVRTAQDYLWDRNKPDARPYLLISLLLQSGMKKAECARLLITDIDISRPQAPELRIQYAEERHAHKNRTLPLTATIVPSFQQYLDQYKPEQFLFECTPRNLEYVLDEVGQRADIKRTQVGFETLRWTCALRDYRTGMSEEQLRQKMGLSKISWRETREKIFQLANR